MRLKVFLLSILFVASFLRIYKLGIVPPGLANDEAGSIYSAYSLWKTGHDVAGKFLPSSINLDNSFSPIGIYAISPFVGILGISPLSGRLPFALIGIFTVFIIFLLAKQITNNEIIGLFSALVLTISPWHLQISRMAFDAAFTSSFFLLAIYVWVANIGKWNMLWSLPAFMLAFYSYHGTKIFFLFFIPLMLLIHRKTLIANKRVLITFLSGIFLILISFVYVAKTQNALSRKSVFLWNDQENAKKSVDWERENSTAPFFVRSIFNNKPLFYLKKMSENYLTAFSPELLFLSGEAWGRYTDVKYRGLFYLIELPLLLLGFYYLMTRKGNSNINLLILSLLIAPLPSTFVVDKTYVFRSVMMLPFLAIIVGCGIFQFLNITSKYRRGLKYGIILIFCFIYLFQFASYLYQYYYRYPIYGAEFWFKSDRTIAEYAHNNRDKYQETLIATTGPMFLLQYGVFNRIEPVIIQKAWQSYYQSDLNQYPPKIDSVTFLNECLNKGVGNPMQSLPSFSLYIAPDNCHKEATPSSTINDLGDPLRTIWKIYQKG